MRKRITILVLIVLCFLLQTTVFQSLSFADISPNLMIILVSAIGFMRGRREGMIVGFISGLLMDLFFGFYVGIYALIMMYIGYTNGIFQKNFYPDDFILPVVLISCSDVAFNLYTYILLFMMRRRFHFFYYLKAIFAPELIYTLVVAILMYFILLRINQWIEDGEKRSANKFDL